MLPGLKRYVKQWPYGLFFENVFAKYMYLKFQAWRLPRVTMGLCLALLGECVCIQQKRKCISQSCQQSRSKAGIRGPTQHMNPRILETTFSGIPLSWALKPECRILVCMWSFGPQAFHKTKPPFKSIDST